MSDSVRPHRRQPTRLPHPWDSPSKNTGVGCHFPLQCRKVKSESEVAQSCPTLRNPMDCSLPGSSSMEFSRQEYWSGVPLPSPMTNLDSILKSRDITLLTMVHLVKAMVFPVVMYDSSRPHGLQPTRLLRPWDFPGKSTGVGCRCLLQNKV